MNREWATFWAAMAVIAASGAATVYAALGKPWEIGSLGEWVSGIMAGAAVVTALHIAGEEAKRSQTARTQATQDAAAAHNADVLMRLETVLVRYAYWFGNIAHVYRRMRDEPKIAPNRASHAIKLKSFETIEEQINKIDTSSFRAVELAAVANMTLHVAGTKIIFEMTADMEPEAAESLDADKLFDEPILENGRKCIRQVCRYVRGRGGDLEAIPLPWKQLGIDLNNLSDAI